MYHPRWVKALWVALLVYGVLRFLYGGMYSPAQSLTGDFYSAFPGPFAKSYNPTLFREAVFGEGLVSQTGYWNYGPGFHLVTLPLTLFTSYRLIDFLTLLAFWCLTAAAFRLLGRKVLSLSGWVEWTLMAALWLNFTPLHASFGQRAIELLELFLIIWAFAAWDRPFRGGIGIGLAATLKFLPAVFFPYLLWKKRWKAAAAAAIMAAIVLAVTLPALPWSKSSTVREYRETTFGQGHKLTHTNNQALVNLVQRAFLEKQDKQLWLYIRDSERVRKWAGWINLAVLGILTTYGISRFSTSKPGPIALELGLILTAMVMLVNRNQTYYMALFLPGISAAALSLFREGSDPMAGSGRSRSRRVWAIALTLAYLMMSPPIPMRLIDSMINASPSTSLDIWKLWGGPGIGGLILLAVLVGIHSRVVKAESRRVP